MKAIAENEKKIDMLRASIRAKEAPLKVAQTRLNDRRARPGIESCHDPAQDQYVLTLHQAIDKNLSLFFFCVKLDRRSLSIISIRR